MIDEGREPEELETDQQRPTDPFTAKDGAALFIELKRVEARIVTEILGLSNRIATLQRDYTQIREGLLRIEGGLSDSRVARLELEVRETELEKEVAERNLQAIEEKLSRKQSIKASSVDTNERIQKVAAGAWEDLEKKRREAQAAYITDLKRSVIKAALSALTVLIMTAIGGFIWWLIQLYILGR